MRKFFGLFIVYFLKLALSFRYRVTIKGLENLNDKTLNKSGGVVFLPNHPTIFVDPVVIVTALWRRFKPHPVVIEYMFYNPSVHWLMRFIDALPMPDLSTGGNSFKRHRVDKALNGVIKALQKKQNVVVYPGGRVKFTAVESLGATSGVHNILQEVPQANVVLVRILGLWGSSFSRALTGKNPPMFATIWKGVKIVLKNLLFFTPRRPITIEFIPAPADFPYEGSRMELNNYLEDFYNQPDGLVKNPPEYKGESLVQVPYYFWNKEVPKVFVTGQAASEDDRVEMSDVPASIQKQVVTQISILAERPASDITTKMDLASDLGLDSLDIAELISFLESQYDVKGISTEDLSNVGKVMAIAAGQVQVKREVTEEEHDIAKWLHVSPEGKGEISPGKTIPEVFLNACDRTPNAVACADGTSGILTYRQLKTRVLIMADYLKKQPDDAFGIMLPSSVAAEVIILACQLAGKVPVMINWTVGSRHFDAVVKLSGIKKVLTSWKFIDRLENIELGILDDRIVLLEDVRYQLSLKDKITAALRSRNSTDKLLKTFDIARLSEDAPAVILFTSGSESMPKGVPLSHDNILSNLRGAMSLARLDRKEILYSILPPFHSFGFTVTGLLPLLSGLRVVYSPDPNDSLHLAHGIEKWGVTILCGAPTFLKAILKVADNKQLKTLNFLISGAERTPEEIFRAVQKFDHPVQVLEGYGITECSPILTMNAPNQPRQGVGQPLPGVELLIVNMDTLEPFPQGRQGLILARGPNIFEGYLKDSAASPFVRVHGKQWYQTGDLGFLDEQGNLTISGRLKRFVKIGGEMISLASIEAALLDAAHANHWPLKDEGPSMAVCVEERTGEKPKIFLFATWNIDAVTVNAALKAVGFSNLIKISSVIQVDEIPVMGTGKVHYRQLEEKYIKKGEVQTGMPLAPNS